MRVTLNDGRQLTGTLMAFDKVWSIFCHFYYLKDVKADSAIAYERRSCRY